MAKEKRKFWSETFPGLFGVAVLGGLVVIGISEPAKLSPFFNTIRSAVIWIWTKFLWLMNYPITLWVIIVFVIIRWPVLYLLRSKGETSVSGQPSYINYTKEKFDKWIWKWQWRWNGSHYEIDDLHACCPECETPLMKSTSGYHSFSAMTCPRGHAPIPGVRNWEAYTEDINRVQVLIIDNVNKQYLNK